MTSNTVSELLVSAVSQYEREHSDTINVDSRLNNRLRWNLLNKHISDLQSGTLIFQNTNKPYILCKLAYSISEDDESFEKDLSPYNLTPVTELHPVASIDQKILECGALHAQGITHPNLLNLLKSRRKTLIIDNRHHYLLVMLYSVEQSILNNRIFKTDTNFEPLRHQPTSPQGLQNALQWGYGVFSALLHLHNREILHDSISLDTIITYGPFAFLTGLERSKDLRMNSYFDFRSIGLYEGIIPSNEGTVYSPPERTLNFESKRFSHLKAGDVWSCGVVMYWLLTGSFPFGDTSDELISIYSRWGGSKHSVRIAAIDIAVKRIPGSHPIKSLLRRIFHFDPSLRPSCLEILNNVAFSSIGRNEIFPNSIDLAVYNKEKSLDLRSEIKTPIRRHKPKQKLVDLLLTFSENGPSPDSLPGVINGLAVAIYKALLSADHGDPSELEPTLVTVSAIMLIATELAQLPNNLGDFELFLQRKPNNREDLVPFHLQVNERREQFVARLTASCLHSNPYMYVNLCCDREMRKYGHLWLALIEMMDPKIPILSPLDLSEVAKILAKETLISNNKVLYPQENCKLKISDDFKLRSAAKTVKDSWKEYYALQPRWNLFSIAKKLNL